MNDSAPQPSYDRSNSKALLMSRLYRYRALLLKKWWIPLLCILVGIGVQYWISHSRPAAYISTGRMIVSIKLAIPEGSVYTEELSNFLGTQQALMQSGVVINRAHARVLAQKPEAQMQKVGLRATTLPKTTIFVLQATGEDPHYTQSFLQACMEEFIALKKEMRTQTSDTTVAGLTEEVLRLEKELRKSEEELSAYQGSNNIIVQDQATSAGNYLTTLNQTLAQMKSDYDLLKLLTLDQSLQLQKEKTPSTQNPPATSGTAKPDDTSSQPQTLANTTEPSSEYLKAKQELLMAKAELAELSQYLRPKHPKIIDKKENITHREQMLEIYKQQSIDQLDIRKNALALQIQNREKDVKEWEAKLLDMNRKAAEFQRLKAESQRIQNLYEKLLGTMKTLDVNKEVSPESVTIMEKASTAYPDRPKLAQQLLIGAVAGLALSLVLLFLADRLDDRMNSFTELQELFDENVLGQIPREKLGKGRRELGLLSPEDTRHSFVEAYRNLRSSLLYMAEANERPRTLLITSSIPNEGKSLTSANFAITLANTGSRVLLVDADLRKGVLHNRFGLSSEPGLTEALADGKNWADAVQQTHLPNLYLLPRGATTQRSSEYFISEVTEKFLKEASSQYDFVVLDTAPVMAADDVTSLAPHLDGILFVIRAEYTSARVARAALDLLYQRQVSVLGLVFNAVRPSSGDYYYYYKYSDYYHTYPTARAGTLKG